MKIWKLAAVAAVALAAAVVPASSAHSAPSGTSISASYNSFAWAGYEVTGGSFRYVSADFNVPVIQCSAKDYANDNGVYTWVGLDDGDYTAQTIEQDGTAVYCYQDSSGKGIEALAWVTIYNPKTYNSDEVDDPNPIHQGDHLTVQTYWPGGSNYQYTIINHSTGKTWTKTLSCSPYICNHASAEVITEDSGGPVDFVSTLFKNIAITTSDGATHETLYGPVGSVEKWTMTCEAEASPVGVSPDLPSSDGSSFTNVWKNDLYFTTTKQSCYN